MHRLLFKFGEKEHMEALVKNGEIYLQALGYYSGLEHRERGDKYEGVVTVRSSNGGILKLKHPETGMEYTVPLTYSQMRESDSSLKCVNIYCLYSLTFEETDSQEIGKRFSSNVVNGFGDTAVMIHDVEEFLSRLERVAKSEGCTIEHRVVQYRDLREYTGPVGPFRKDTKLAHQNEYRIVVGSPEQEGRPMKLNVGSLDGVAAIVESDEVPNLKFSFAENQSL